LSVTDAINGIQNGTNAYTYDILNRVTKLTQSGTGVTSKRVDMTYNAVNQIATLNRYSDLTGTSSVANTSYSYDAAGRLTGLIHKYGANTLASYELTYDAANRIIQSAVTDGTQDYSYDSTNQLTTADHTTQTDEAYSYDANGNRTNAGYGTGTNNQLLTDGTYNYEYDGEGNRTKRTEIGTGKVTEYVWDYRNRLTSVLFKDASGAVTKTIEYLYDVNDRRIGKQIDGVVTERYVYDGLHIALVFDGTGTQTHRYLYGTQIDQVLADERGGIVVWALSDNQGTVRDVMDGNGMILNHVVYDSYGQVVGQSDATVEFRYGYTGREQDNETGLDYYRARYYDAANGRFISEDPIGFSAGDSNLTRYVGNSPVNAIDPSGLEVQATYNIKTGTLTVMDLDSGKQYKFDGLFSGDGLYKNNPYYQNAPQGLVGAGPIPTGKYEILDDPEHPAQTWYRLDPIDSKPRNDVNDDLFPWRNGFRIHPGTYFIGCITFKNGADVNDPNDRGTEYNRLTGILSKLKPRNM
jgi:RHS repeat-associated protein